MASAAGDVERSVRAVRIERHEGDLAGLEAEGRDFDAPASVTEVFTQTAPGRAAFETWAIA